MTRCRRLRRIRRALWEQCPCCVYCLAEVRWCKTTLDHLHPRIRGGTDDEENLVLACACCNTLKADADFVSGILRLAAAGRLR